MEDSCALDVKAGRFAVVKMSDGRLKAVRIVQVWEPGESVEYDGRDKGPAEEQMVSLERLCLTWTSSIIRVLGSDVEARVFTLEREVEEVRAELLREREAHARSRDRLRRIGRALASVGTVRE